MNDPVTMRRQLVADLRRMRSQKGLTQRQVADELDWSPSKIIRIEKASVAIGITDLQALLRLYGEEDQAVVERYVSMARGSKRLPFNEFRDDFNAETLRYFRYESTASVIRQYQTFVVPGLLQTEEYARGLLQGMGIAGDRQDNLWAARVERQELLTRDDPRPPEMSFILSEAAVRQSVGGESVMHHQRQRLIDLSKRSDISIGIIPFSADAHPGMYGSFAYLSFEGTADPDVLQSEGILGVSVIRDEEEVTSRFLERFFELEKVATAEGELEEFLSALSH